MAARFHLGDAVEVVTNSYASQGVERGSVGRVTDQWSDGEVQVEVIDRGSHELVARTRMREDELDPYSGNDLPDEPRKHGVLFGRGDALAPDVEEPPSSWGPGLGAIEIPGYTPARIAFSDPPPEPVTVEGDIPWELQDAPQTGPIII